MDPVPPGGREYRNKPRRCWVKGGAREANMCLVRQSKILQKARIDFQEVTEEGTTETSGCN